MAARAAESRTIAEADNGVVTAVRGSLLCSSQLTYKAMGLQERYSRQLTPELGAKMMAIVASEWVDIETAYAHYDVCDRLPMTQNERERAVIAITDRVNGPFLRTVARSARAAGLTPWTGLRMYPKLWERLFLGGMVNVAELGPKDARTSVRGLSLLRIPYFRDAFASMTAQCARFFATKVYVRELSAKDDSLSLQLSWV